MALIDFPRTNLAFLPTPLTPLKRLQQYLGDYCPNLFIKRDDCTGLAQGGNKTRKLEFLIGDALRLHADTVITEGAIQSNHVRQTVAACASKGLTCEVILTPSVPRAQPAYTHNGNVLLDQILGARIHYATSNDDVEAIWVKRKDALNHLGRRPYFIPGGGSNSIGGLGYAAAIEEITEQCNSEGARENTYVIHASASGGTQAGLIAGNALLGNPLYIIGINVYKPDPQVVLSRVKAIVANMKNDCCLQWQAPPVFTLIDGYQGEAYGIPTQEGIDALLIMARQEGILLDPVYTAKAMSGLIDQIRKGKYKRDDNVVFLHTGGATALHAYPDVFNEHRHPDTLQ